MSGKPAPRLPIAPLLEWFALRNPVDAWETPGGVQTSTLPATLARRLHLDPMAIYRARRDGVTMWCADKYATTLNVHPLEIWPEFHADCAVA